MNHPNIAHIYAIEEHDGEMFIVIEYINYATQIAAGLQAAHKKGAPTVTSNPPISWSQNPAR
ncbi:MAG: hypothetical protein ACE5IR_10555 [bacterium]